MNKLTPVFIMIILSLALYIAPVHSGSLTIPKTHVSGETLSAASLNANMTEIKKEEPKVETPKEETPKETPQEEKSAEELMKELEDLGGYYKDWNFEIGLVDFPAMIGGEEVFLCWRSDEKSVHWYHSMEEGYGGRTLIPEKLLV